MEVTFPRVAGTGCSEGGQWLECFSGSFGGGKSESCSLRFHLIRQRCLLFGNMCLKAKKQLSNVKARKASLITFFFFFLSAVYHQLVARRGLE